jgi:hypothetical protein
LTGIIAASFSTGGLVERLRRRLVAFGLVITALSLAALPFLSRRAVTNPH